MKLAKLKWEHYHCFHRENVADLLTGRGNVLAGGFRGANLLGKIKGRANTGCSRPRYLARLQHLHAPLVGAVVEALARIRAAAQFNR